MKTRALLGLAAVAAVLTVWLVVRSAGSPSRVASFERAAPGGESDDRVAVRDRERSDPSSTAPQAAEASAPPLPVLDRQKRDQLRALIWQSFGQEAPDAALPPAPAYVLPDLPPWPTGPSDSGPGIEPKYIQERVRNDFFPLALKCYTDMTERIPDAGGSAVLAFNIVGNQNIGGIVEQVDVLNKSTLRDPAFVDCMRQSFLSVRFPAPEGGGSVSVEYPIEFSPDDPGDD